MSSNLTFRNKVCQDTKLKFYRVIAVPVLFCWCEQWMTTVKQVSKIRAVEIAFLKGVKRCSNKDRRNELYLWPNSQTTL